MSFFDVFQEVTNSQDGTRFFYQINDKGNEKQRTIEFSKQFLLYNSQDCEVMTLRDISKIQQLTQLKSENEMLGLLTSSVSHEMLTPLKCIISVGYRVRGLFHDLKAKEMVDTIISAAGLTLN